MTNKGKRYNQEFKSDILKLIQQEKRSVASIVTDFGVSEQTVRNWLKQNRDSQNSDKVKIAQLEAELKELEKYGIIRSMSRKGNCWDNACAETFFSTIKSERLHHRTYKNLEEARLDIFWYIECFYNRQRRHQALDYITPVAFLEKYHQMKKAA